MTDPGNETLVVGCWVKNQNYPTSKMIRAIGTHELSHTKVKGQI